MRALDQVSSNLLAAANRGLQESGLDGLTVRRIALDADMSTMNIYSRFGSLSGLIDCLVVDGFEQFERALASVAPTGDVVRDLVAFAAAYRSWVLQQPARYRLMMTRCSAVYEPGPSAVSARRGLMETITARVLAARAARVGAVAPMTAGEAAKVVISMLHGMLLLELDGVVLELGDSVDWAERVAVVMQFGLGRPTPNVA